MAMVAPVLGQAAKPTPKSAPAPTPAPRGVPWTQWGGPHGNFHTESSGIKDSWRAGGPPVVWKRALG